MGRSYYFYHLESYKIRSPLEGYVKKVFPNQNLLIVNNYGLQILLSFNLDHAKKNNIYEILKRKVEEGDKVSPKKILFIIYQEKKILNVVVYVYWQPWILKKMGKLENNKNYFTSCYYRNPFGNFKWKRHGRY